MQHQANSRLAIDPQLRLRNDIDRAVLLTKSPPLSDRGDMTYLLHPRSAILLSLFDGERTIEDIKKLWATLFDLNAATAEAEVEQMIHLYGGGRPGFENVFLDVGESPPPNLNRYDPMDFVIPRKNVNLQDTRLRIPYSVYYLPTLFCPQKCIYCYAKTATAPEDNLLSLGRLREIFQELGALGVDVINLSGGDPLARKDILEIIASIVAAGITPDIPTKVGLSHRRILELKALGIKLVQVSLDAIKPTVLDEMVGLPGYHQRAFRLLEDLRSADMGIRVNTVVTPVNLPYLAELVDFLGNLGNVRKVILSPYGRSMFCHQDRLFVENWQLEELERQLAGKDALYPHMKIVRGSIAPPIPMDPKQRYQSWQNRAMCTANRHGFVLLPDGKVTVCEELYDHPGFIIGDLKVQSVMEMWNSPRAMSLLNPDQSEVPEGPCRSCKSFDECNSLRGRCWRDVIKSYGWARPYFPDPRCPKAPPSPRLG